MSRIVLTLSLTFLLCASAATDASAVILSSDVMLNGGPASNAFPDGYSNATGVEIIRGGGFIGPSPTAVAYTANVAGPTVDLSGYGAIFGGSFNLGANINGRGGIMFAPGDGETTSANAGGIGFGTHGANLVTFDLNVIRTTFLSGSTLPLELTGRYAQNGQGGPGETVSPLGISQGVIFVDGVEVFVSNLKSIADPSDPIDLLIPNTAQFLSFAISGGDASTFFDDGSFRDMELLTVVPEPSTFALAALGLLALGLRRRRRRR